MKENNQEFLILVNEKDEPIGAMEKMKAHEEAVLHRAFSVFIYNSKGEMMLQQRAFGKYHSPGLWTNACCSHPRNGETTEEAAHRRLVEEMGFDCEIRKELDFVYKADVGQGLTEHEFDHVFTGMYSKFPGINPEEVNDWKFMEVADIKQDIEVNPDKYTVWFKIAFNELIKRRK
ncbi:MAG: isopentenyl-diphosphate Delta-isomerase [Bacteroidales bacterium]|nr:isopentenyl-diphosphate Delta-isomerase [Bacteroidales bacterium]